MYIQHFVSVNVDGPSIGEFKKDGRFHGISKAKGAISLSPSHLEKRTSAAKAVMHVGHLRHG
jgi:hypothetical protein